MSEREKESVGRDDFINSLVSAVKKGNLERVKKLFEAHNFSRLEGSCRDNVLLCDAIEEGHVEIAKFLLQKGVKADPETNSVNTPLHFATGLKCADLELVLSLLEKSVSVDPRNSQNETPLHLAARKGRSEIVQTLLDHNANVIAQTCEGLTPLFLAIEGGHEEVAEMLLEHGYIYFKNEKASSSPVEKKDSTFLNHILLSNPSVCDKVSKLVVRIITDDTDHSKIINLLIDYGFILSGEFINKSLLLAAAKKNYAKFLENILMNGTYSKDANYNPLLLHTAVKNGHKETVELLLKSGFDANAKGKKGKTSVYYSLNCKEEGMCVEVLQALFASGANVKEAPELLHSAVSEGFVKVCKVLVENGADVTAVNTNGNTPLHLAVPKKDYGYNRWEHQEDGEKSKEAARDKIAKLLLSSGANVSIKATDGGTPFHHAVKTGRKEAVRIFLDFGVFVDIRAEDNSTPLLLAAERGLKDIVELLCENEANVDARRKNGSTALHRAVYGENSQGIPRFYSEFWGDVISILLDNGCDVNVETNGGDTALSIAISGARSEYVKSKRELYYEFYSEHEFDRRHNADAFDDPNDFNDESSSDEDDYIDEHFHVDGYSTVWTLKKHLMKLKAAGMYVSRKNLLLLEGISSRYTDFEKQCEEEVHRMKNEMLQYPFTLYDIFTKSKNPTYVRNETLMQNFKSFNLESFPTYGSIIRRNFEKSQSRLELLNGGKESLVTLLKTSSILNGKKCSTLPDELLELIVSYLINCELRSLICCGETVKHQLHL